MSYLCAESVVVMRRSHDYLCTGGLIMRLKGQCERGTIGDMTDESKNQVKMKDE